MEEYWKMFVDAWRLFRKYASKSNMTEMDYQELARDTMVLGNRHPSQFFRRLQVLIVDEIERAHRREEDG